MQRQNKSFYANLVLYERFLETGDSFHFDQSYFHNTFRTGCRVIAEWGIYLGNPKPHYWILQHGAGLFYFCASIYDKQITVKTIDVPQVIFFLNFPYAKEDRFRKFHDIELFGYEVCGPPPLLYIKRISRAVKPANDSPDALPEQYAMMFECMKRWVDGGARRQTSLEDDDTFVYATEDPEFADIEGFHVYEDGFVRSESTSTESSSDADHWCSVAEAARRLNVTPTAIRNRMKRGTLRSRPNESGNGHFVFVEPTATAMAESQEDPTGKPLA